MVRVPPGRARSTEASSAIRAGARSPMGEPLAILPPTVACARTCREPKRCSSGPRSGASSESGVILSATVTPAPSLRVSSSFSIDRSAPILPRSMTPSKRAWLLFTQRPTSVDPAMSCAVGTSLRACHRSSSVLGTTNRPLDPCRSR